MTDLPDLITDLERRCDEQYQKSGPFHYIAVSPPDLRRLIAAAKLGVEIQEAARNAKAIEFSEENPYRDKSGVYTASRVRHARKWREARDKGLPIVSTWINEAGKGETPDWSGLWLRCIDEAKSSAALVLYREDSEPLKGALVEVGAALGAGVPVFTVGCDDFNEYSWLNNPLVTRCHYVEDALSMACRVAKE